MELLPVSSSNVRAYRYVDGRFVVQFRSGDAYAFRVREALVGDFQRAQSKGAWVHRWLVSNPAVVAEKLTPDALASLLAGAES